jgi:hypothetical protein
LENYFLAGRPTGRGPKYFNQGNWSPVPLLPTKWPVTIGDCTHSALEALVPVATDGAALIPRVGRQEQLPGYHFAFFTSSLTRSHSSNTATVSTIADHRQAAPSLLTLSKSTPSTSSTCSTHSELKAPATTTGVSTSSAAASSLRSSPLTAVLCPPPTELLLLGASPGYTGPL